MIIYPAIDLRGGKVVRLKEGDPNRQTVFSDDPVATAQHWIDEGATWLHIVNLDGAFDDANNNEAILKQIAKLNAKIQFGGGLRSATAIVRAMDDGADRVIVGTSAVQQPEIVIEAIERYGADAVCVALDARDGRVTTHGWQQATEFTPIDYGRRMAQQGVKYALYTDVHRDGRLTGVNVKETVALGRETGLRVIASGGITAMDEIHRLAQSEVVEGVVIGMALYEERITLGEALLAAGGTDAG
jgi:phosphoribosylformimino-5-aminoimidazole carboxamide ribotide isomerase